MGLDAWVVGPDASVVGLEPWGAWEVHPLECLDLANACLVWGFHDDQLRKDWSGLSGFGPVGPMQPMKQLGKMRRMGFRVLGMVEALLAQFGRRQEVEAVVVVVHHKASHFSCSSCKIFWRVEPRQPQ